MKEADFCIYLEGDVNIIIKGLWNM